VFRTRESTSNLEEVCEIFTRINKKGMTLSTFDLMNAFLFPYDISLRKDWEELEGYDDLKAVDSTMNTNVLKTIGLRKRDYCSSKYIYQLIPGTDVERRDAAGASRVEVPIESATEFRDLWEVGIEYCEEARQRIINTGTNDFGAIKNDFIPHTTMLPVLAALLWEYDEQFAETVTRATFDDRIVQWYWSAALSRDYSGSSDSIMAQDFREMKAWLEDADEIPERVQTVDAEFIDQNLDLQSVTQGGRYSAVLGLYGLNTPKDFHTGRRLGTYNADRIDDHHIFPKNVEGLTLPPERKHSILNRALILDETNREQIQNRKPSDYLQDMESTDESIEERLRPHLIPEEGVEALWNDDFEAFIEARERAVPRRYVRYVQREVFEDRRSRRLLPVDASPKRDRLGVLIAVFPPGDGQLVERPVRVHVPPLRAVVAVVEDRAVRRAVVRPSQAVNAYVVAVGVELHSTHTPAQSGGDVRAP